MHESKDVLLLGASFTSVRGRWLPWIIFSRLAPNSTIFIPKGSYFDNPELVDDKLYSYGNVSQIMRTSLSSAEILIGVDPEDSVVVSIEDVLETRDPYFVFAMRNDGENRLIPSSVPGMATVDQLPFSNHGGFALVEWGGAGTSFHPTEKYRTPKFYGLFIETALLSEDIRAKLLAH